MGDLPYLDSRGVVRFDSAAALSSSWDASLGRGVLIVAPGKPLSPLEHFEVIVECPAFATPLRVPVEVVHLDAARAMLRVLAGPQPKPAALTAPTTTTTTTTITAPTPVALTSTQTPAPMAMPAPTKPASSAAWTPPPVTMSPMPAEVPRTATPAPVPLSPTEVPESRAPSSSWAAPRLVDAGEVAEIPRASSRVFVRPDQAQKTTPTPKLDSPATSTAVIDFNAVGGAASVAATLPPYLATDVLRFHGGSDLKAARVDLESVGAVLAVCDDVPPTRPIQVRVSIAGNTTASSFRATIAQARPGTVVVQALDKGAVAAVFAEVDADVDGPKRSDSSRLMGRALTLPTKGHLWNPTTPAGVLGLAAHRPVTDADLERPSVVLLLRWLRTRKGISRIELTTAGQPMHTFVVVDGREIRSPVSLQTLGRSLAAAEMDYEVVDLPRPPQLSHTGRTLHLIVEGIRALIASHDVDAIAQAFPHTQETRIVRAVPTVADALGFQGPHARMIKSNLAGDDIVANVTRGASGARVAWDVLVCLELFGGLTFASGEPRRQTPGPMPAAVLQQSEAKTLLSKDHFACLGLHWSSSPTEITPAWQRARALWLPGGAKRSDDKAENNAVIARLDAAYAVLNDAEARRAYRRTTFNMVWPHQAQMLVAQAKLALYRKELLEARNLLLAAQDMSASNEAAELLMLMSRPAK